MWYLAYIAVLPMLGAYYGKPFMGYVFFLSFFLAMVPFASKYFLFLAPIIIWILCLIFYPAVAWWSLFFVPLWYISVLKAVVDAVAAIIGHHD